MRWRPVVLFMGGMTGITLVVRVLRLRAYAKRVHQLLANDHGLELSNLPFSDRLVIRKAISRSYQEGNSVEQAADEVMRCI